MHDPFEIITDESWKVKSLTLAGKPVEIAVKRCETRGLPESLLDKFLLPINSCGGAIIMSGTSPVPMITVQEMEERARLRLGPPPKPPYWEEVVVFRKINFQQMLDYITYVGWGDDRQGYGNGHYYEPDLVRAEGYKILTKANTLGPMCFNTINYVGVLVKYSQKISKEDFSNIVEMVLDFNEKYFLLQLSRDEWREQNRYLNGFGLGPG